MRDRFSAGRKAEIAVENMAVAREVNKERGDHRDAKWDIYEHIFHVEFVTLTFPPQVFFFFFLFLLLLVKSTESTHEKLRLASKLGKKQKVLKQWCMHVSH